jgi:hypothetical protein
VIALVVSAEPQPFAAPNPRHTLLVHHPTHIAQQSGNAPIAAPVKPPKSDEDLHRQLSAKESLTEILTIRRERIGSLNLALHYDRMVLILEPNATS